VSTMINYERTGDLPRTVSNTVVVPFNQYEVSVLVSESGQILGIHEIKVRKDFRKPSQIKSVDFDQYYRE
jgi:hypothetical protein